jgi:hypothetical protein
LLLLKANLYQSQIIQMAQGSEELPVEEKTDEVPHQALEKPEVVKSGTKDPSVAFATEKEVPDSANTTQANTLPQQHQPSELF